MKETTLDNIADGVALELFQHEMKKISKNIGDVNTAPITKRKLTLTFEFAPDAERSEIKVHVSAKSTLAPTKGYTKTVFLGKRNGELTIFGQDTQQLDMLDESVARIDKKENKNA